MAEMNLQKLAETADAKTAKAALEVLEYGITRTCRKAIAKALEEMGCEVWISRFDGWTTYEVRYGI